MSKVKAVWKNTVLAEANEEDTLKIDSNCYFPPESLKRSHFTDSVGYETVCHWRGLTKYYHVDAKGETIENGAWYYPVPDLNAIRRVAEENNKPNANFVNYVCFCPQVSIEKEE